MDRTTVAIYERESARYEAQRRPRFLPQAEALGARRPPGMAIDLGCGPGWYTAALGEPVVALDAARSMVRRAHVVAPTSLGVQADLGALPFRRGVARGRLGPQHLRAPPPGRDPDGVQRPPPRPRARSADRGDRVRRRRGGLRGVPRRRPPRPLVLDVERGSPARRPARRRLRRRRARRRRPWSTRPHLHDPRPAGADLARLRRRRDAGPGQRPEPERARRRRRDRLRHRRQPVLAGGPRGRARHRATATHATPSSTTAWG